MTREPILFLPADLNGRDLAHFGRRFLGVPYATHRNYLFHLPDGTLDLSKSSLNCFGFLLATARDAGLLPPDFDLSRARWRAGQTLDSALWELLQTNFERVDRWDARIGDVFLMWFRDVDSTATEPHHVAIKSAAAPIINQRRGRMLHAIEADNRLQGAVVEQDIDALEWARIHSAWRLKTLA